MDIKKAAMALLLAVPAAYAQQNTIQDTLNRLFTSLHQVLSVEIIKWGLGLVALGFILYGLYSALLKNIPFLNAGEKLNTQGKMMAAGLMLLSLMGLYGSEKLGWFSSIRGVNLLIPGTAVAIVIMLAINKKMSASHSEYISAHSRTISMIITALLMLFMSTLFESTELIMIGIGIIILEILVAGASNRWEHAKESKMEHNPGYREQQEGRRNIEEKHIRAEQTDELKTEEDLRKLENHMKDIVTRKESEVLAKTAAMEREEDQIIHKIYAYLQVLNKNEVNIRAGDKIVIRGGDINKIKQMEYLKRVRVQYKDAIRKELGNLSQLLMEEASLKEKQAALTDDEIKEMEQAAKKEMELIKKEEQDIKLKRKEMTQTVEEIEKSVDRGEIRRIEKEEDIHNRILADLIKQRYAAKKEKDMISRFGKAQKYEKDELIKVQNLVDGDNYVGAAGELKKILRKVRQEEKDTAKETHIDENAKKGIEDAQRETIQAEDITRQNVAGENKEIKTGV